MKRKHSVAKLASPPKHYVLNAETGRFFLNRRPKNYVLDATPFADAPADLSATTSDASKADPDAISKAIGIFSGEPTLTDREVCRRAGIKHPSTLTRSTRYQRVKETFAASTPPKGSKNAKTGDVEAYE